MNKNKIVRQNNRNGNPCVLLGPLIKQNGSAARPMVIYQTRSTSQASIPARLAHLEPCPRCPDHRRSKFVYVV